MHSTQLEKENSFSPDVSADEIGEFGLQSLTTPAILDSFKVSPGCVLGTGVMVPRVMQGVEASSMPVVVRRLMNVESSEREGFAGECEHTSGA